MSSDEDVVEEDEQETVIMNPLTEGSDSETSMKVTGGFQVMTLSSNYFQFIFLFFSEVKFI